MEQSMGQAAVSFSWKEPIGLAFEKTKEKIWFLLGVLAVAYLVQIAPEMLAAVLLIPEESSARFFFSLISWILSVYMSAGILRIMLRVVRGEETRVEDLFADPKLIPHYLVASLLYGLIIFAGFLLLIVPGVVWSIKYGMFGYFLVERKAGIMDSFRQSAALTYGAKWQLFALALATMGIVLLGLLAFFVGVFFALPLVSLANAYAYILLSRTAVMEAVPESAPATPETAVLTEEIATPEQPKEN